MYDFNFTIQMSLTVGNRSRSNLLNDSAVAVLPQINSSQEKQLQQQLPPFPGVPSQTKDVVFVKSAKEVTSDGSQSILKLAEAQGVKIRSGCRKGICGGCKKQKLEGDVTYKAFPVGLKEHEQKEGYILPCVAYPLSKKVEINA